MDCVEVLSGKCGEVGIEFVSGMKNSVRSKKSRNKKDREIVRECEEILDLIKKWEEERGIGKKEGNRGKYEGVEIKNLSDDDLSGMYESLYSRRSYYIKGGNSKKVKELDRKIEEVKNERRERKINKIREEMKK